MNKKLLAVAVAAAVAAPLSAQAGSDVTLYGIGKLSQEYVDQDGLAGTGAGSQSGGYDGWDTVSRASRLGVKGSEDLGGGLKAIFKMEFEIPMTDSPRSTGIRDNDRGQIRMRNSYVGLAGKWGTALIGRHDTPLKVSTGRLDLFSDELGDYNTTVGFVDVRADNTIAYISPSWNGLTFAGAVVSPGGSTTLDTEGNRSQDADGFADAFSVALMYSNGPWYGSGAFEYYDEDMLDCLSNNPTLGRSCESYHEEEFTLWRFGFGYNAEAWSIGAIYEGHKDDPFASEDTVNPISGRISNDGGSDPHLWQIQGQYKFGNNAIKAMFGQYLGDGDNCSNIGVGSIKTFGGCTTPATETHGDDDNEDADTYALGFDHNFSKRTKVGLQVVHYDSDYKDSDWTGGSLLMHHKF